MRFHASIGYLLERFPVVSNLYTVQYQRIDDDDDEHYVSHFQLRTHPFYALLHDILNPLRIIDATLNTLSRIVLSFINIFIPHNNNHAPINHTPLQKIIHALSIIPIIAQGAFIVATMLLQYFTLAQAQSPVTYQSLINALSNSDSNPMSLPLRSHGKTEYGIFHWLYKKISLKGGTLQNQQKEQKITQNQKDDSALKHHRAEIAFEEQFDNPSLLFGLSDMPYQMLRYVAHRCFTENERKVDSLENCRAKYN